MSVSETVHLSMTDGVAVLTIDHPPVNTLDVGVRRRLVDALRNADQDDSVRAVLLLGKGKLFSAGADIKEFGRTHQPPTLHELHETVEGLSKPTVVGIHGTALGGAVETALCCTYRVADRSAQMGLPEVHLGLVPGAGGTQRLPRLVGAERALKIMVGGENVDAETALSIGLIDKIVDELTPDAIAFARSVSDDPRPRAKVRDMTERLEASRKDEGLFGRFRDSIARKTRGFDAPEAIVRCVEDAVRKPFEEGLRAERERFAELLDGPKAQAQMYAFFAQRRAAKIPGMGDETPRLPVNRIGIIGAGTMGGGISMCFLNAGLRVTIVEASREALDRGQATIRSNYQRSAKRGRLDPDEVDRRLKLLTPSLSIEDLADCDLIIEAVFEEMELKKETFRQIDEVAKENAILATNTSALDINEIAAVTGRPEFVLGTHFFSPANVMRLCEVVRADKTSEQVLATVMRLAKQIGKVAVVSGVCHGFIGNRILFARQAQADRMILEGAMPWDVDRVLYDFGMPMGPFAMLDLAGLDIGWNRATSKGETIQDVLCEIDRRGQKTGAGYYAYDADSRAKMPDPKVEQIIIEFSGKRGIERRSFSDDEILQRLTLPMINEGAKILDEGIAARPSDIDVVWVNGYGWPTYRGGPMHHADRIGIRSVLDQLREFQQADGDASWQPSPLIERMAEDGTSFGELN